jgi:hypothetical protein
MDRAVSDQRGLRADGPFSFLLNGVLAGLQLQPRVSHAGCPAEITPDLCPKTPIWIETFHFSVR